MKNQFSELRRELPKAEYIMWWVLRAAMVIAFIYVKLTDKPLYVGRLVLINTLATFAIPILRFISPRALFTSEISFRTQSLINIFVLMGSFLGNACGFNGLVCNYDKIEHFLAGFIGVFIGFEIIKTFKNHENSSPAIKTFCATGFSCVLILIWENMEFLADWFITGSNNQGYHVGPGEEDLFVRIFGMGKNYAEQAPVYDTNVDMLYAELAAALGAVVLFLVLRGKDKKAQERMEDVSIRSEQLQEM